MRFVTPTRMASAGLLKIVTSGLQDDRLRGNPSASFFKKTFLRAGRFTTELHRVDFDNSPAFGTTATATLPRRGHLITRAYLVTRMPDITTAQAAARAYCTTNGLAFAGPTIGWTNSLGHALITQAQLLIGGVAIDTLDGRLLEVMDEFHTPLEKTTIVNRLLCRTDAGFTPKTYGFSSGTTGQEVITPLPFWFNRGDPACALPIDAIGTDVVQLQVTFAPVASLTVSTSRIVNGAGQQTYPATPSAPFFYINPRGTPVAGLNGNPGKSVLATQIPGIQMPALLQLKDASLLLEYVYLDKPEANRLRLGDLTYPVVQHYAMQPVQSKNQSAARVPMRIPNPIRDMYFAVHRTDADALNAPFLATRDLSGLFIADISGIGPTAPWWPDASLISLTPAFSGTDSEPITSFALTYEGKLTRYATDCPALFRIGLPSVEQTKTPWHNKYYYHLPFGTQHEVLGVSRPTGHANLDRIQRLELSVEFKALRGAARATTVPDYTVYVWAETYNLLRVYGGRAGLLFGY